MDCIKSKYQITLDFMPKKFNLLTMKMDDWGPISGQKWDIFQKSTFFHKNNVYGLFFMAQHRQNFASLFSNRDIKLWKKTFFNCDF